MDMTRLCKWAAPLNCKIRNNPYGLPESYKNGMSGVGIKGEIHQPEVEIRIFCNRLMRHI